MKPYDSNVELTNAVRICTFIELLEQQSNKLLGLELMIFVCLVQDKSEEVVMPRYLTLSTISSLDPFSEK